MKRISPAAERNKAPLFEVLNPLLSVNGRVLEIASGSGQHAAFFCIRRPDIIWNPSDMDQDSLASIREFQRECSGTAMKDPVCWSVCDELPAALKGPFDALVNINMIHISPWQACSRLLDHAMQVLPIGGLLFFYGPFFVRGRQTAPSNLAFDQSLKERNPQWGLRDLDRVVLEASTRGLQLEQTVDMPANNLSVIFRKKWTNSAGAL